LTALAVALLAWLGGGLTALALRGRAASTVIGLAAALVGALACAAAALGALTTAGPIATLSTPWTLPGGAFRLLVDPLAGVFLVPLALMGGLGAGYGVSYLRTGHHGAHGADPARSVGAALGIYALLLGSMALVVTANDLLLLLIAWETMTLTSWALVVSDHQNPEVRAAGLEYLIASHLATAVLFFLLLALAQGSGTFEIAALDGRSRFPSGLLFLLAVVGFGTKAGIVPVHVWLPDAHPAAPSHVSALMSAVMVTMGFYGLARFLPILGEPAVWWGHLLLVLGAAGAVGGVLFAVAQRDVKRVLAYSTVENAGITTAAIGLALLGASLGRPDLVGLGWTAALLHVWNHALAKGGLFLGFGAAAQAAGSRNLDDLGGLLARWPRFGAVLALLAAAIAAIPGLNVFTSEWLLLRALLRGGTSEAGLVQVMLLGALVALAFAGGLAIACFARLVGVALLGSPRTDAAAGAPRLAPALAVPVVALAGACALVAAAPAALAETLAPAVERIAPSADVEVARAALDPLGIVLPLVVAAALLALGTRALLRAGPKPMRGATWGCGYPAPTAAMQYTSASFAEPITRVLQPILATETQTTPLDGAPGRVSWPGRMRWASRTADRALALLYRPFLARGAQLAVRLRAYHRPRVSVSLLYIAVTAVVLIALLFLPEGTR
jgi:formate hydrogenlyase subunit 3/multisubunit Na+/H+ antiporter MnhD subunit